MAWKLPKRKKPKAAPPQAPPVRPPPMADEELPIEVSNGMAAMVIYVLVRYYVVRSTFVKGEREFLAGVSSKFSELVKRVGEKQTVDILKQAMDMLSLRIAESSSVSGALEELGFSKALRRLGFVKQTRTGGKHGADSVQRKPERHDKKARRHRKLLRWRV